MSTWLELGKQQAELFANDNFIFAELLITTECSRGIMVVCYTVLVRTMIIGPIEKMAIEDKQTLWETAKEIAKGRLGENKMIELSKALVSLEYFLNL
jgi:hypothetical protein